MTQNHPDPITEGLHHGGQRLVQLVSAVAAGQQLLAQRKHRLRAAQQAMDRETERAEAKARRATLAEARSHWVRAHDRKWLRTANLLDVAGAWGAAVSHADDNASATLAVRRCEEQLRRLHPHGMTHYDRLRGEGKGPLDAMAEAAPFFARDPNVRTGDPAPNRAQLPEGTGAEWAARVHGPDRGEWEQARQEQRAGQLAHDLRAKLRLQGREPQPAELRAVLEITTNLPEHAIAKAVPEAGRRDPDRGADIARAAEDFPFTIDEALETTAKRPSEAPPARRTPSQVPDRNRRRNL
ncbi:hypothetical protein GCM10022254_52610 [Actinomadura meridiana]|uniref:Uncharacterized protein n=1 Tax=Actinomadura meridiana TaxID=559626 RepID=A0ABP8CDZ4_9ACTN